MAHQWVVESNCQLPSVLVRFGTFSVHDQIISIGPPWSWCWEVHTGNQTQYQQWFYHARNHSVLLKDRNSPCWKFANTTNDSTLRRVVSETIGLRLDNAPIGFPGFCNSISIPWPSSSGWPCSSDWLNNAANGASNWSAAYLSSSPGNESYPQARALLSFFIALFTPLASIGCCSGWLSPLNAGSPVATSSRNCWQSTQWLVCLLQLELLQYQWDAAFVFPSWSLKSLLCSFRMGSSEGW